MAKKTTSRSKAESASEPAAPAKPSAPAKAAKPSTDKIVVGKSRKATAVSEPTEDQIRVRAYEIYIERGGDHGLHLDDWIQATLDLRGRK